MTLLDLEKQVLFWTRSAIIAPILVTGFLSLAYFFEIVNLQVLFFIACGLYFLTAVIWWWWTMKSVHLLIRLLDKTSLDIEGVSSELKSIRKELQVDNISDN